jgi:hypothetical protein
LIVGFNANGATQFCRQLQDAAAVYCNGGFHEARIAEVLTTQNLGVNFAPLMHPNYSTSTVTTLRFAERVTACAFTRRAFGVCGDLTD